MAPKVNGNYTELSSLDIFEDTLPSDYSFQASENDIEIDDDLLFYGSEGLDDALLAEFEESFLLTNPQRAGSTMDVNSSAEFPLTSNDSQTDLSNRETNIQVADATLNKCLSKNFILREQSQACLSMDSSDLKHGLASRNLVSERKRRRALNEKLFSLRALVPNVTKMDKTSIVADAITYVHSLHKQIREIRAKIFDLQSSRSRQTCPNWISPVMGASMDIGFQLQCNYWKSHSIQTLEWGVNDGDKEDFRILELEVSKVEEKTYLLRISCKKQAGVVTQLTRALENLNILVINSNITTFAACILNTAFVEVEKWDTMPEEQIRQEILAAASMYGLKNKDTK